MDSSEEHKKTAELTMRIRPDLKVRLEELKVKQDRSVAWLVERCIEAYLPALEAQATQSADGARLGSRADRTSQVGKLPAFRRTKK
jgi:predicted transcriptional regulator